jgi:flagellar hook-associated protein 1 FlgK
MSLSSAISTAQSILSNTSRQTLVVSQNISNAGNPDYSRRAAQLQTSLNGAEVISISRAQDQLLFTKSLSSQSVSAAQNTVNDGLERIRSTLGGNDYELSPSRYIGDLRDNLQALSATPGDLTLLSSAISNAQDVANSINQASSETQTIRLEADQAIERGVDKLNSLLALFETVNNSIVSGTRTGVDVLQELDQRDMLLRDISSLIGVQTLDRGANDLVLYTDGGQTLFETVPRPVSFTPTNGFDATITGNPIYIDGVPLDAGQGAQTSAQGELAAHLQIRDEFAPRYQSQLDEIARGLVTAFAEQDQSVPATLPDMPGLFTWVGASVPAGGTIEPGIAATLAVNPALILGSGGDPALLRDGGINGAAYIANPSGGEGFSALLDGYITGLDAPMAFDVSALAGSTTSVVEYASNSIGWLEMIRSEASIAAENREAIYTRTQEAYSNATGVNLDEEMALLLNLEQSYKASTQLLSTIDEMINTLLAVAR